MKNTASKKETEQDFGRSERLLLFVSGMFWWVVILVIVGFFIYLTIAVAMMD